MSFRFLLISLAAVLISGVAVGHPADENPDLTLPETTREFRQDRLGLFIHWSADSVLCEGESVMQDRDISITDYEKLPRFFNPAKFAAAEWVTLAKASGARYITFTTKHRDGFAMWNSAASDWNVVDRTPFARDVVKELAEECRREGIKLFLYYSPIDLHHSHLVGNPAGGIGRDNSDESTATLAFTHAQLTELLTDYGKIDGVWLDGWWDSPSADEQLQQTYQLIRKFQPAALIGNNHHRSPLPGEDFQIADHPPQSRDITSETTAILEYSPVPLETSDTINRSRGYNLTDNQHKSIRELVHSLVRAAGSDANYLINIGAMPDGTVQQEFADRLRRLGMWLAKNGTAIYATRGGPMPPQAWGVTTHRGDKVYVHVLDPEATTVTVQLPTPVRTARYFADESDVPFEVSGDTVTLSLRSERRGEMERLIVLQTHAHH